MSKQKDASKCDERQVRNKPNRLAKKKKGEIRRMNSKSMKHWKVSLLFVVGLMVMAGVFAEGVEAQKAEIEVSTRPTTVITNAELDSVMVEYNVDDAITDATATGVNTITISLPTGWVAADSGVFGDTLTPAIPTQTEGIWYSKGAEARATEPYVKVDVDLRGEDPTTAIVDDDISGSAAPTVTDVGVVTVTVSGGMTNRDSVVVTFYRVMVRDLVVGTNDDLIKMSAIDRTHQEHVQVDESIATTPTLTTFEYDAAIDEDNDTDAQKAIKTAALAMVAIDVRLPQSAFAVDPTMVTAEAEVEEVTVTYALDDDISKDNTITIELPTGGWGAITDDDDATDDTFGDTLTPAIPTQTQGIWYSKGAEARATEPYVKVDVDLKGEDSTAVTTPPALSAAGVVTVTVSEGMTERDSVTVTFYRVMVRDLSRGELQSTDMITDKLIVSDSIRDANFGVVVGTAPSQELEVPITVKRPMQSTVDVTPDEVKQGEIRNIVVTYEVEEEVFKDNSIFIGLPEGWKPAKPATEDGTRNSFGAEVMSEEPIRSLRNSTSYVILEYDIKEGSMIEGHDPDDDTTPESLNIRRSGQNANLDINVMGGMEAGDTITVTFKNVMVEMFEDPNPKTVHVEVDDDIGGADYTASTMIKVLPPKLGRVTVKVDGKTAKSVTAESTVDLTVRYVATSPHLADDDTYGRIKIQLPKGWGHAEDEEMIHLEPQVGNRDATYLRLTKTSKVDLKASTPVVISGSNSDGWTITIDVDKMIYRQWVDLTVHNLMIGSLDMPRNNRSTDITSVENKVQVTVTSHTFDSAGRGEPLHSALTVDPKVTGTGGSETQPTITVTRKELGVLTFSPTEVTAGSKRDFTINYEVTEAMDDGDVIEIRLPKSVKENGWKAPTVFAVNASDRNATDRPDDYKSEPYAYLSGSATRLTGAKVVVIDDDNDDADPGEPNENGWIVKIELGENGAAKGSDIVLKYYGVTVQRSLTTDDAPASLVAFSGTPDDVYDLPQFPVKEQAKDIIKVIHAADGSGVVTFMYETEDVTSMNGKDSKGVKLVANTNKSIPAGLAKGDRGRLFVTYTPEGDMGAGEFEFRLPSDWDMEDVRVSGGDGSERSGNTVTVDFNDHFGEQEGQDIEITFVDITVPSDYGEVGFTAKSKNAKSSSLKQLSPRPMAFVGNALASRDTVGVNITPAAAYEDWEDVNFEIELTNAGPMHDSQIRITVPEGLSDLQTEKAADANYVKMVSTSARSVRLSTLDIVDEDIIVQTGKLNADGRITIRFENVDLREVSTTDKSDGTDATTGFRVATRTRGSGPLAKDDDDEDLDYADLAETDERYVEIHKENGDRSIIGGLIRTIKGSGTMVVEVMSTRSRLVEQNARDQTIKLTYTAAADFTKKNLVIQMPSVIETGLQETSSSGKGHVSTTTSRFDASIAAADQLKISSSGRTITWTGVTLRRDQTFVTLVKRVDLLEYTGDNRWDTSLDGESLPDADNKPMVVVGTTAEDVAFRIVENGGVAVLAPSYPAASKQSIRFQFTAENTTIQPGGKLRFTVPSRWTFPSLEDRANRATVRIVSEDADGNEDLVTEIPKTGEANAGSKMVLSVSGRTVTLTMGATGELAEDASVTIQYGTTDLTKFPIEIPSSVAGTSGNLADGLAIHGSYLVSDETGFRSRSAGTIWVDVTNVEDGTGTVSVTPPSVRASSTDNLIRITYKAAGTMDGGAVHLIIPDDWGAAQDDDNTAANYINVTVGTGAVLTDFEVLNSGRSVEANLKTFADGDTVMFSYGGGVGTNKGAVAQAEVGEATFIVESKGGGSDSDFVAITDEDSLAALTIDVKGAASGSGTATVTIMNNKSGEVVYDTATGAERRIFAGDDKTYLVITYTAEQSILEGELELIVPSEWTMPQDDDTNKPGFTYLDAGDAFAEVEPLSGYSVKATIENVDRGDEIEIHYGWYDAEDGGAHAPSAAGTSEFQVEFDGSALAIQPSVIVHGGEASKLVVTAPSTVSADPGATSVAVTVEIQDDTNAAAVMGSDLEVTLSSTNSTGSFTDADGEAIANNRVTISAGSTEATAYYNDTTVGTATITATAVGLGSGTDTIEVTSDVDAVDENSISVSPTTAKAGDSVTVTASGTAGRTATFSVGTVVTTMTMTESPANSGSYSGSFNVVRDRHDGTHNVTVYIGDASDMVANAVTVDTNAPTIVSGASASPSTVGNGDMVTISAAFTGATSVTADVSALDSTQTSVTLTMANGSYSASVTISDDNAAANGSKTITVTAMDAAGNSATSTATVTLDNKLSYTSMIPVGQSLFHVPLDVEGLDTVGDLKTKIGNDVLNAIVYDVASGTWDARADDMAITAGLGILLVMGAEASVTFEGQAWGDGTSSLSLGVGSNLVGLGVNDARVTNVGDIIGLFPTGAIASITVSTGDAAAPFAAITAAGAPGDVPVMGDAAYLISVPGPTAPPPVALIGNGWSNGGTAAAAPVALAGYNVDGQTAVLDVSGAVVDEITGLASEGFRVKVKNLSTKASLSKVTSAEIAEGYNMTFVDLKVGNAARIGDVLEISADSPNPLIGVKPVRRIVTVDDVKNSRVMLENLIAYEIPAETELLRNYPNPFNPETWIPYHLSEDANVSLTIYDVNGALVRDIDVGHQIAAKYDTRSKAIYWDGRNRFGEQVASGIYFYSLSAGDFSATRKMVILK